LGAWHAARTRIPGSRATAQRRGGSECIRSLWGTWLKATSAERPWRRKCNGDGQCRRGNGNAGPAGVKQYLGAVVRDSPRSEGALQSSAPSRSRRTVYSRRLLADSNHPVRIPPARGPPHRHRGCNAPRVLVSVRDGRRCTAALAGGADLLDVNAFPRTTRRPGRLRHHRRHPPGLAAGLCRFTPPSRTAGRSPTAGCGLLASKQCHLAFASGDRRLG